jgi:hypothetical protein
MKFDLDIKIKKSEVCHKLNFDNSEITIGIN